MKSKTSIQPRKDNTSIYGSNVLLDCDVLNAEELLKLAELYKPIDYENPLGFLGEEINE